MMPRKFPVFILFTLLANLNANVQGQLKSPTGHLKKSNPDELYVRFFQVENCPGALEQIVDSELAQSRIKRLDFWDYNELILHVGVDCLRLENRPSTVYDIRVKFAKFLYPTDKQPDEYSFLTTLYSPGYSPGYGSFGITRNDDEGTQFMRNSLRESIEKALLDYLKVNFDL